MPPLEMIQRGDPARKNETSPRKARLPTPRRILGEWARQDSSGRMAHNSTIPAKIAPRKIACYPLIAHSRHVKQEHEPSPSRQGRLARRMRTSVGLTSRTKSVMGNDEKYYVMAKHCLDVIGVHYHSSHAVVNPG